MQAWLNMGFTDTLTYPAQALFDIKNIFVQNVNPFQQKEYCDTFTFGGSSPANNTNLFKLFQLSSHTHKRGKRWRFYQAPQTPCASPATCTPGTPGSMFYESFEYSDPLDLTYNPPLIYTGSVNARTIKYCSLYDNGATDPSEVKRRSTSPCPPIGPCGGIGFGGPCPLAKCLGGSNMGNPCKADSECPGSACNPLGTKCLGGARIGLSCGSNNDCAGSVCDACNLLGGVTTEDEMFIPLGTYFITPP
jgi:hypothetical protein